MNWNSAGEFFAMGGYALYVWGSFGVCACALVMETLLLRKRHNTVVSRLRREALARQLNKDNP